MVQQVGETGRDKASQPLRTIVRERCHHTEHDAWRSRASWISMIALGQSCKVAEIGLVYDFQSPRPFAIYRLAHRESQT